MSAIAERSLKDVLSFVVDNRGRSCPVVEEGIPLIATNCVVAGHRRVVPGKVRYVSEETYRNWFRAHPMPHDVLLVCKGNAGRVAVVPDPVPYCIAQDMVALRADTSVIDPLYLYYRLSTGDVQEKIASMHVGTLIPHFKKGDFKNLRFAIHADLGEQRHIASVLGALDDLIETDRQLVAALWKRAASTYRRAAEDAADSTLAAHLQLRYGKALPAPQRVPGAFPVVSSAGIVGTHDTALVAGPGVVVGRKGTVGSVTWVFDDFFPIDTAFYVDTTLPMLFAFFALRCAGLDQMNTDSAVPGLNRENALARPLRLPSESSLARFTSEAGAYVAAIQELEAEITEVARARDELLPLLMSGRVRATEVVGAA